MKTYCKNIDPLDLDTIRPSVYGLISDKYRRRDYARFISNYCDLSPKEIRLLEKYQLDEAVDNICIEIIEMFRAEKLVFSPVQYTKRVDPSSRKERLIGVEDPLMQCAEHVIKDCLSELWEHKFEYHQYATIKGKGQVKGAKQIQKWVKESYGKRKLKFAKLDVRHCFQSIKHEKVIEMLRRDIGKNKKLVRLVALILEYHGNGLLDPEEDEGDGLVIGSILSQFICNYMMSYSMRYNTTLHKTRRGKRIRIIRHQLYYMDDIFLAGTSSSSLESCTKKVIMFIEDELGLQIKDGWCVKNIEDEPIDMMGFRIFADGKMDIRPRTFLKARRCYIRGKSNGFKLEQARRATAYYGYFKHSRLICIHSKNKTDLPIKRLKLTASKIISTHDRGLQKCTVNQNLRNDRSKRSLKKLAATPTSG